jgi:hypothetical protein
MMYLVITWLFIIGLIYFFIYLINIFINGRLDIDFFIANFSQNTVIIFSKYTKNNYIELKKFNY